MSAPVTLADLRLYESPDEGRYHLPVATDEFLPADEARKAFAARAKLAKDESNPVNTVVMVHGHPEVVLVSVDWYIRAREKMGEPVAWQFPPRKRRADEQSSGGQPDSVTPDAKGQ